MLKKNLIAVGDIHGMADSLELLLDCLTAEYSPTDSQFVFLGDIVDRGPDSQAAVSMVSDILARYPESVLILGNHDCYWRDFLRSPLQPNDLERWAANGGIDTMNSYGFELSPDADHDEQKRVADHLKKVRPEDHALFESAVSHFATEKHFFVHAGVDPVRSLSDQSERDLMWIRDRFIAYDRPFEKMIVHGHSITPSRMPEVHSNRIGLDSGSYGTGRISAGVFVADQLTGFLCGEVDREGSRVRRFNQEMREVQHAR